MTRLVMILHMFIGSTLAGTGIIAALVMGYAAVLPILAAGGTGFLLAFPVSWWVAKQIYDA